MRYLSLFDGIGAAHVAWNALGWECVGVSEIEAFPIAVTKHHFPETPHLGDVTKITEEQIAALGRIDIVVGGFPCQDLSVAGKRAGLKNDDGSLTRSGLFFDAMRVVRWARERCDCRFLLIENVLGLYSSNQGRDFAAVVGEMVGAEFGVPPDGWRNTGVAAGPDGLCEWATLDAQYFHLAQRRVRVFALADFGDWASRPPILFERASLQGHPPPRREARQDVAGSTAGGAGASRGVAAFGGNNTSGPIEVATACNAHGGPHGRLDFESETFVAHSLRGEGFDGSEDGTGRGTPLVPVVAPTLDQRAGRSGANSFATSGGLIPVGVTLHGTDGTDSVASLTELASALRARIPSGVENSTTTAVLGPTAFDTTQITSAANYSNPQPGDPCHPLAAGAHPPAVAFAQNSRDEVRLQGGDGQIVGALAAEPGMKQTTYVAFHPTQDPIHSEEVCHAIGTGSSEGCATAAVCVATSESGDVASTLRTGGNDHADIYNTVAASMQVRRLTATECERLQGFPDHYTRIPWRNRPAEQCPDGPRYRALGNSMAVPVMRWIGQRIAAVTVEAGA